MSLVNSANLVVSKHSACYSLNACTDESIRMVIDKVQRNRCLWDKKCREYSISNQKKARLYEKFDQELFADGICDKQGNFFR
jgi:hypothetical protein